MLYSAVFKPIYKVEYFSFSQQILLCKMHEWSWNKIELTK